MGLLLQRTDSRKTIHIHSWYFSHILCWKPVLWFVAAIGFSLLADNRNWHPATDSFDLQQEAYSHYLFNSFKPISGISRLASRYQPIDFPLSVVCSGRPVEIEKPHILAQVIETCFFN
jgi:hypothetical protein